MRAALPEPTTILCPSTAISSNRLTLNPRGEFPRVKIWPCPTRPVSLFLDLTESSADLGQPPSRAAYLGTHGRPRGSDGKHPGRGGWIWGPAAGPLCSHAKKSLHMQISGGGGAPAPLPPRALPSTPQTPPQTPPVQPTELGGPAPSCRPRPRPAHSARTRVHSLIPPRPSMLLRLCRPGRPEGFQNSTALVRRNERTHTSRAADELPPSGPHRIFRGPSLRGAGDCVGPLGIHTALARAPRGPPGRMGGGWMGQPAEQGGTPAPHSGSPPKSPRLQLISASSPNSIRGGPRYGRQRPTSHVDKWLCLAVHIQLRCWVLLISSLILNYRKMKSSITRTGDRCKSRLPGDWQLPQRFSVSWFKVTSPPGGGGERSRGRGGRSSRDPLPPSLGGPGTGDSANFRP